MMFIKPKKSLGQNFLVNEKIYQFIVQEVSPQKEDLIIEVGPGEGILTEHLAQSGAAIVAVEKDSRLIPVLKEKFKNQKNVIIIEDDILKLEIGKLIGNWKLKIENYKLVGNIPYYLTSHLIKTALEKWPTPELILFMVQKEVAQRITAKPPKMNLLALGVQLFAKAKMVKNVSRGNFRPIPKVDSALIKIIPKKEIAYSREFQKKLFELAHAAFQNKRKQILNSLTDNLKLTKEVVVKKLAETGLDPTRRPESLNLEEWEKLTQALFSEQWPD